MAEMVYREMLAEAKVPVHFQSSLKEVRKEKKRLTEIRTENGFHPGAHVH